MRDERQDGKFRDRDRRRCVVASDSFAGKFLPLFQADLSRRRYSYRDEHVGGTGVPPVDSSLRRRTSPQLPAIAAGVPGIIAQPPSIVEGPPGMIAWPPSAAPGTQGMIAKTPSIAAGTSGMISWAPSMVPGGQSIVARHQSAFIHALFAQKQPFCPKNQQINPN